MELELKKLTLPDDWKIDINHFVNLEPDNDYPIDKVWDNFIEDILYLTNGDYFIDLGFYGSSYLKDRAGFFRLIVAEGNFLEGRLYESFISRSTEEVKSKIEIYSRLISEGEIKGLSYLSFDKNMMIEDYLFSAIENLRIRLTDKEYNEYRKPKTQRPT